jgi:rfaE bifunctional protein kinase chain/domain
MLMNQIEAQKLISHLDALRGKRILIVGDLGVDEYVHGQVHRISPEAPVPVLEVDKEDRRLGLSANVAQNISSFGAEPILLGVTGDDGTYNTLCELLATARISPEYLIKDPTRPTTRKLRVMAQHHHIVRVDYEHRRHLAQEVENKLLARYKELLPTVDGVILQDYAKGVVSERVAQEVIRLAKEAGKRVVVDPNRTTPLSYYRGADLMTPNHDESVSLAGYVVDDLRKDAHYVSAVGQTLMSGIGSSHMVITLGKNGMRLFEEGREQNMPTFARQVFDVTGAGDTVIAVLTLAWVSGLSLWEACQIANFAAGVVVGKIGCVPCEMDELRAYIQQVVNI